MALAHQIELAAHTGSGRASSKFTDETIVPVTLAECAFPPEDAGLALNTIHRQATCQEDLVGLLAEILGEG